MTQDELEKYETRSRITLEKAKGRMGASEIGLRFCMRQGHELCTLCDDFAEPSETEFFLESTGGLVCLWCAGHLAPPKIYDAAYEAYTRANVTGWTSQ